MLIIADENIPNVRRAFSPLGELRSVAGRGIAPETIRDAEVLLVRSVTRIDKALLEGSRIRFLATATAGTDHVDLDWLKKSGIAFAAAPGCNAESVAQYIAAVLFRFRAILGRELRGRSIGIVGAGHCGSRVQRVALSLGMEPVLCDPPLSRLAADGNFRPLKDLARCDFVTLHVPLTRGGPDATEGMIDSSFIQSMARGSALINASRGGVVDEPALLTSIGDGRLAAAALDAWVGEPSISIDAVQRVDVATPHIAGYSAEGKLRGTEIIYRAFCRFANLTPAWSAASELPAVAATVEFKGQIADTEQSIAELIEAASPLRRDDADLRKISALPREEQGPYFDSLRKNYPVRREFSATRVIVDDPGSDFAEAARSLGFSVSRNGFREL